MDVRPYNIPDFKPFFGGFDYTEMVRPTLPAIWTIEVAGFSYVDPEHPNATNSGNTNGSRTTPRLTLPVTTPSSQFAAGHVVIVKNHIPYSGNGKLAFCSDGTDANPVWLGGEDANNRFSTGMNIFFIGQNIICEHVHILEDGASLETRVHDAYPTSTCKKVCFRFLYAKGAGEFVSGTNTGIAIQGSTPNFDLGNPQRREYFIIFGCDFTDLGSHQWTYDNGGDAGSHDYHAYSIVSAVSHVWVLNNIGDRCQGDGLQIGVAQLDTLLYPEHLYMAGNQFHSNGENSFDVKKVRKVIYSTNDNVTRGTSIVTHDDCEDVFLINNSLHDSTKGMAFSSCYRNYAIGNRFWNILPNDDTPDQSGLLWGQHMSFFVKDAHDCYAINNSFNTYLRGWEMHTGSNFKTANNVMMNRVERPSQTDPRGEDFITEGTIKPEVSLQSNYFEDWQGRFLATSSISTDIADLNGAVGTDITNTNNTNSSNMLVNETEGLAFMTLQAGSDLIDAGDVTYYDEVNVLFTAMFGLPLDRDLFGFTREQGTDIDVGCSEYGGTFAPAIPLAPSNILVNAVDDKLVWNLNSLNETSVVVYENGISIATLGIGIEEYSIAGIATATNSYRVGASNTEGDGDSSTIQSDILSITPIAGDLSLGLDDAKSYLAVRPYINSITGSVTIDEPQYTGGKYGIDSTKVIFTKSATEVGNGFNYITNDSGSISGNVAGTGTCDVKVALNSYNGTSTSRLTVNDTYVDMDCVEGDLAKFNVSIGITTDTSYTITPVTIDAKHATGIISIAEQ